MTIYAIRKVVYGTSPDNKIIEYFAELDKAIEFTNDDLMKRKAKNISKVLKPTRNKYFTRIEYKSYFGDYDCAYEFVPIEVIE